MAESTLSVNFGTLKVAAAQYLGYGRTSGDWTTRQTDNLTEIVKRGMRMFLWPDVLPGEREQHEWSFMRPIRSLTLWPTTTTAAITVSGPSNTILTAGSGTPFYPSMVGKSIVAVTSGNSYAIAGYTSSTVITVAADASADTGDTFTITADGDYRMPDDFQDIEGPLYYTADDFYREVRIGSEADILNLRQTSSTTGWPTHAAMTPEEPGATPSRWNLMVYPTPNGVYPLKYRSLIAVDALSSDSDSVPGGMAHAETIRAAICAAAELEVEQQPGVNYQHFMTRLRTSVSRDRMAQVPESLGMNRDRGLYENDSTLDWHQPNPSASVYYNGQNGGT